MVMGLSFSEDAMILVVLARYVYNMLDSNNSCRPGNSRPSSKTRKTVLGRLHGEIVAATCRSRPVVAAISPGKRYVLYSFGPLSLTRMSSDMGTQDLVVTIVRIVTLPDSVNCQIVTGSCPPICVEPSFST